MLILSRRIDESLVIGTHITVTVLGVKGNQVRLGIKAPHNVVVDREEVHRRKLGTAYRASSEHEPTPALAD